MQTKGRALYNTLQMNWQEDPSLSVESWQIEDYRKLSTKELFKRLKSFNISLDEDNFKVYGDHTSSPEEMTDALITDDEMEDFDQVYLIVFELWRRLLPEKESLSIFCDELDHLIDLYDQDLLENDEPLNYALTELERLLDENTDQGEEPQSLFEEISLYCAHDLQSFIYDFASDQIDQGNELQASEIIEGFSPYLTDKRWFEFLELRLISSTDPEEGETMLERILEEQIQNPDLDLLLEMAKYLVHQGDALHYIKIVKQVRPLLQTEQDFQELLAITSEFYRLLDMEEDSHKVSEILKARQSIPLEQEISSSDKLIEKYYSLIGAKPK